MSEKSFILAVGSTNGPKVRAVQEILKEYPFLSSAVVVPIAVQSEVADQPMSLEETILGAKNRAENSFKSVLDARFSVGIEGGLMPAIGSQTGFIHMCVCSIYNGKRHHIGLSTGFEIPPDVLRLILEKNMDLSQACFHAGITDHPQIGAQEGLIGILTNGRVTRQLYCRESIIAALVQLENAHWFSKEVSI